MGAPKQKWTQEEESALRAGVEKYGAGKWRAIQKDPNFSVILKTRSNVDLKDKWRNLSACQLPGGSRSAAKTQGLTPGLIRKQQMEQQDMNSMDIDSNGIQFPDGGYMGMALREPSPLKLPVEKSPMGSKYDDYILEAVAGLNQPEGSSVGEISTFVEGSHEVPQAFRKYLNSRLKSLLLQNKLMKVDNCYKISDGAPRRENDTNMREAKRMREADVRNSKRPRMDIETAQRIVREAEEASFLAARAIAEAEAASLAAEQAAQEASALEIEAERLDAYAEHAARPGRKSMRTPVPTLGGAFAVTV